MNDALRHLDRATRRNLLNAEARAREVGNWGNWETVEFPRGSAGRSWAADFTTAHKNRVFSVLDRTLPNGVRHFAVASLSGIRPSWREMQRIKDDLAGQDATAVEVYPPRNQIVDEADMFHIWILPQPLTFSLSSPSRGGAE